MSRYKELIIKQTGKDSPRSEFKEIKVYNKSMKLIACGIDVINIKGEVNIDYMENGNICIYDLVSYEIFCGVLAIKGR